jgi:Secretion system C-terminal sorting domain
VFNNLTTTAKPKNGYAGVSRVLGTNRHLLLKGAIGDAEIHILDIAGKTVLTTQKTMFKGLNEVVLDISSLVNGIYMVQYKDAVQNMKSLRMVKN